MRWYVGNQVIVTVGEPENYSVADTILKSSEAQAAVGKVMGLGYTISEDQFLLDLSQVMPFAAAAASTPAMAHA